MFDLATLASWPPSCSGWGYAVGAAAARIPPRVVATVETRQDEWPAGVMAGAPERVREQVAALLADDVLIELAHFIETRDTGHVIRARRMVAVFGSEPPALLSRMLEPYRTVVIAPEKRDTRAAHRLRREWLVTAVEQELARKARGCPGAVPHAKAAYARVGARFGTSAGSVKHAVEAVTSERSAGGKGRTRLGRPPLAAGSARQRGAAA